MQARLTRQFFLKLAGAAPAALASVGVTSCSDSITPALLASTIAGDTRLRSRLDKKLIYAGTV